MDEQKSDQPEGRIRNLEYTPRIIDSNNMQTKITLIVLLGVIIFHIAFLSSKTYSISDLGTMRFTHYYERINANFDLINLTSEEYYNLLTALDSKSLYDLGTFSDPDFRSTILTILNHTKISYLWGLNRQFCFVIYIVYFLLGSILILLNLNIDSSLVEQRKINLRRGIFPALILFFVFFTVNYYVERSDHHNYYNERLSTLMPKLNNMESDIDNLRGNIDDIQSRLEDLEQ